MADNEQQAGQQQPAESPAASSTVNPALGVTMRHPHTHETVEPATQDELIKLMYRGFAQVKS